MHDRPSVAELLDAIAHTLDEKVLPAVAASARHDVRVAANLCRIIRRELTDTSLSINVDSGIAKRTRELIETESPTSEVNDGALLAALCELIERPELSDETESAARAIATEIVEAKLNVSRPGYGSADSYESS